MTIEVIDGAGHFLPEEAPDAVLRHIGRFIDAGGARGTRRGSS